MQKTRPLLLAGFALALLAPAAGSPRIDTRDIVRYTFPSGGEITFQVGDQPETTVALSDEGQPPTIVEQGPEQDGSMETELIFSQMVGPAKVAGQNGEMVVQFGSGVTEGRPRSLGKESDIHRDETGEKWRASSDFDVYGNGSFFPEGGGAIHFQFGPLHVVADPYIYDNPPNRPRERRLGRVDHYKCYTVKPKERFKARQVTLADQFEDLRATVVKPLTFCAPVRKNKGPLLRPAAHLKCYAITGSSEKPKKPEVEVGIENQFGAAQLVVLGPRTLCAPTLKKRLKKLVLKPPPPRGSLGRLTDHFTCYDVRPKTPFEGRTVSLEDQFEIERAKVLQPVSLCAPVEKNGVRLHDGQTHLTCYAIQDLSRKEKPGGRVAVVKNQFGTETLTVLEPQTLCVPSTKKPPCSEYAERTRAALIAQGQQIGTINSAIHRPFQGVAGSPCE